MKIILTVILLLVPINIYAGSSALVIAYGTGNVPVNSAIDIDAEYVAMSVSLSSDAKYPSKRAEFISKFQSGIRNAASNNTNIDYQQGAVSLSPREKSSFSFSKSYSGNTGSNFYLLSKLDDRIDVYAATQSIYEFIKHIQKPDDTNLRLGNTSLAISTPKKYRNKLLEMVKEEINATKTVLGAGYKVTITGLENPIIVRQKNDKQVTVFIDYRFEFTE